jgi:hypothetical protein
LLSESCHSQGNATDYFTVNGNQIISTLDIAGIPLGEFQQRLWYLPLLVFQAQDFHRHG